MYYLFVDAVSTDCILTLLMIQYLSSQMCEKAIGWCHKAMASCVGTNICLTKVFLSWYEKVCVCKKYYKIPNLKQPLFIHNNCIFNPLLQPPIRNVFLYLPVFIPWYFVGPCTCLEANINNAKKVQCNLEKRPFTKIPLFSARSPWKVEVETGKWRVNFYS